LDFLFTWVAIDPADGDRNFSKTFVTLKINTAFVSQNVSTFNLAADLQLFENAIKFMGG
jgi:hypothetical protein